MEVRSYYASTVQAAMELARQELGPEALLIQSVRSGPETEHLGRYEVVFAGELQAQVVPALPTTPTIKPAKQSIRRNILPDLANDLSIGLGPIDLVSKKPSFASILTSLGVVPDSVADPKESRKTPTLEIQRSPIRAAIPDLACSPGLGRNGYSETAVALVGPSGAGKTTTIMKLSLIHGVLMSRPVRLLSFDPGRIGTSLRLQRFAELLNLEFTQFDKLDELSSVLAQPTPGITFIDTASYARSEASALSETAACLLQHSALEIQLVLRADRKIADNRISVQSFSPFQPARLILTALDESSSNSDLVELVESSEIPVSFLGVGQRIPEDLEPASSRRLAELILKGWPESSRNAA